MQVAIIMGSDSDLGVMKEAALVLESFGIHYDLTVVSAHRTPQRMYDYATKAHTKNIKVIIAGAGGAAHLPGMVASLTHLPVIGVPIKSSNLNGEDSLLSIVQMPPGVPVATVAINGAKNAGLLAVQILATADEKLAIKMIDYKKSMQNEVEAKAFRLEKDGFADYLKQL
jgi:5-(carboxyamino)imidazole ribonucleotide mutase